MTETVDLTVVSCYGPGGASTRVRVLDWVRRLDLAIDDHNYLGSPSISASALRQAGPRRVLDAEWNLRRLAASGPQRLLLSREATPFSRGGIEARLLREAQHSVYDIDDGLAWDVRPITDAAHWFSKRLKSHRSASAADVVLAGSPMLFEWAFQINPRTVYLPSCVEPSDYVLKRDHELHDPPRLVWLGSPSTEPLLASIAESLLEVHKRSGARLQLISAGNATLGRLDVMVDRFAWGTDTFAKQLAEADVAIAPLVDTPYNRAKCAYKMLQYAATGLPIVASPIGANATAAALLECDVAADSRDWVEVLLNLLGIGADQRAERGRRARVNVQSHYSFAAHESTWKSCVLRL